MMLLTSGRHLGARSDAHRIKPVHTGLFPLPANCCKFAKLRLFRRSELTKIHRFGGWRLMIGMFD